MFPPSALRRVRVLHADFVRAHPFPDLVTTYFCKFFGGVDIGLGGKFF